MESSILVPEDVAQLLREANCPDEFAKQFLSAMETKPVKEQLRLLRGQRSRQLERLHREEKRLDQLDFLRDVLEKQLPADTGR